MLKHLYIKNFTLIDQLDIAFHSGFSVITGETQSACFWATGQTVDR